MRPGVVVGPYDHTERFVRWVRRAAEGGEILAPGEPEAPTQFIDGRDLGDWTIRLLISGRSGVYNATGPWPPLTVGRLLETCAAVAGTDATLTWVDKEFLAEQGVTPWADLPLWLPPPANGMVRVDVSAAVEAGLTYRPLEDTARATLQWDAARAERGPAGMGQEREQELLGAWHARATH